MYRRIYCRFTRPLPPPPWRWVQEGGGSVRVAVGTIQRVRYRSALRPHVCANGQGTVPFSFVPREVDGCVWGGQCPDALAEARAIGGFSPCPATRGTRWYGTAREKCVAARMSGSAGFLNQPRPSSVAVCDIGIVIIGRPPFLVDIALEEDCLQSVLPPKRRANSARKRNAAQGSCRKLWRTCG
jgi:hypothetical protein